MSYSLTAISKMFEQSKEEFSANIENIKKEQQEIREQINQLENKSAKNEEYLFNVMLIDFATKYPNLKQLTLSSDYESDDSGGSYSVWIYSVEVYDENLEEQTEEDIRDLIYDSLNDFDSETIIGYAEVSINFDEIRAIEVKHILEKSIETPLKREKTAKI